MNSQTRQISAVFLKELKDGLRDRRSILSALLFPLLGPLGLLPYPVRYRIVYGEPMEFHDRFGPEDADDPRLVRYLARQVRHRVQQLVDCEL